MYIHIHIHNIQGGKTHTHSLLPAHNGSVADSDAATGNTASAPSEARPSEAKGEAEGLVWQRTNMFGNTAGAFDGSAACSNTLQHTATHCNTRDTLQHTATPCDTLQHATSHSASCSGPAAENPPPPSQSAHHHLPPPPHTTLAPRPPAAALTAADAAQEPKQQKKERIATETGAVAAHPLSVMQSRMKFQVCGVIAGMCVCVKERASVCVCVCVFVCIFKCMYTCYSVSGAVPHEIPSVWRDCKCV